MGIQEGASAGVPGIKVRIIRFTTPVHRAMQTLATLANLVSGMRVLALMALLPLLAYAKPLRNGPRELPEDIGPAVIDVSSYPAEYQKTYKEIFLPVYGFLRGGPARALNSPLIAPDDWRREVMRVKNRPPCCGACPILSMEQARALWRFLVYDSARRKTGINAASWAEHRRGLIERFAVVAKGGSHP
jgi:hypothetical protein